MVQHNSAVKPGRAAITAPKPYSDAVFIEASSAPPTAVFVPSANFAVTGRQARHSTARMPTSNAPWTAQIAAMREMSCTTGTASCIADEGNVWLLP